MQRLWERTDPTHCQSEEREGRRISGWATFASLAASTFYPKRLTTPAIFRLNLFRPSWFSGDLQGNLTQSKTKTARWRAKTPTPRRIHIAIPTSQLWIRLRAKWWQFRAFHPAKQRQICLSLLAVTTWKWCCDKLDTRSPESNMFRTIFISTTWATHPHDAQNHTCTKHIHKVIIRSKRRQASDNWR